VSENHLTVPDEGYGRVWGKSFVITLTFAMSPLSALITEFSDPLGLNLLDEHRERYERIKAWREAQRDRYFDEVPAGWHREFAERNEGRLPTAGRQCRR